MSARCNAKTTAGKQCRAAGGKGGLCALHADPKVAAAMGRKSGQARRTKDMLAQERAELSPPRTASEVRVSAWGVHLRCAFEAPRSQGGGHAWLFGERAFEIDRGL